MVRMIDRSRSSSIVANATKAASQAPCTISSSRTLDGRHSTNAKVLKARPISGMSDSQDGTLEPGTPTGAENRSTNGAAIARAPATTTRTSRATSRQPAGRAIASAPATSSIPAGASQLFEA
jgi:hypothetical protein